MNTRRWVARREKSWQQLEALVKKVENEGLKSLSAKEISTLAGLYRSVAADLARARTQGVGETLGQELQLLTSKGYSIIYQGSRRQESEAIGQFYLWGFPAVLRDTAPYILLCALIFALAGLVGWWFAWSDPSFMELFLPPSMIAMVERGELWMGRILTDQPGSTADIMVNNIHVSLIAVGGGITAGFYTVYILGLNGLFLGVVGALVAQNNLAFPFWAFVFPHGSLEIPEIFISGGGGLLLARALLFPGRYRRADAFKVYGEQAAQLVLGCIPMLVIAAILEGFVSPSPIVPDLVKYLLGVALFTGFLQYAQRRKANP
ncbi:MAG: stage II sporulation protein M [Pseudanabaenaceae cyanobacterium SKYGB_i_bin29]|nr:stage II sporulation protein M [Pseudanabaenaceae cyanobacterium SKYG29]MDW8421906.1 stage II sporulation protein M [Pseudanabaenaceae cyanobacterium SKYGB_i_bin29]